MAGEHPRAWADGGRWYACGDVWLHREDALAQARAFVRAAAHGASRRYRVLALPSGAYTVQQGPIPTPAERAHQAYYNRMELRRNPLGL